MNKLWYRAAWTGYVLGAGWLGFSWQGWQFVVGNLIALCLELVDKLVYAWWLYPFEQSSIQIQYWTRRRDVKAVLGLLINGKLDQHKLIFRSLGFALMWVMLAIYVASSTGSVIAMGIVMGLGFDLAWEIVKDWKNPSKLGGWLCWQIKRPVSEKEAKWCGGLYVGVWLLFLLRLIWG